MAHLPMPCLPLVLSYFEMNTVICFDPNQCKRPYHDGAPIVRTAMELRRLQRRHCTWHQFGVWQHLLQELRDYKFSAHNFFGFTQDVTIFTILHYQPDVFANRSQLNRCTYY